MKVRELIEKLKDFDPEAEVLTEGWGNALDVEGYGSMGVLITKEG